MSVWGVRSMNPGASETPGRVVSSAELSDLLRRLEDIYTHLKTNRRHLHTIEDRAEDLKNDILALVPPEEEKAEEEAESRDG